MATMQQARRSAITTILWGAGWVIAFVFITFGWIGNPIDELALILSSNVAPGYIIKTWEDVQDTDEGGVIWDHGFVYTYRLPGGREFTGSAHFPGRLQEEFTDLQEPYPAEVEFLPHRPRVSRLKDTGCQTIFEWCWRKVGIGTLLLVAFLSPGFILIRDGYRELKRLKADTQREEARKIITEQKQKESAEEKVTPLNTTGAIPDIITRIQQAATVEEAGKVAGELFIEDEITEYESTDDEKDS